ncbi:related to 60S acidic ribosomal protein P1-alpha [Zygosaccharomyces bailii]|uniref:BN860_10990g1_1 n=1 Tax=Zygosaccharomyces bailii (strain CLIB 213 / ATCC 58445 / CBS 680 / BCRC 21525 / NBRC 1098 / NCYC 1416 / NRRL Y-2227) TaxID=1333698 RepID=A0A8J2T5B6_ZYGB2|nr:BN860_10990g1_1 [Zygosaccharomyces bailii CLIB 213]CDH14650.1 related to 60S acidic ribosomal protein P1-alpha [Zygosaccharomyces bailii ISA1307]SJM82157.1 related to 60S acidic ribosomal protein P1-alpha [Zygosaccharomyces bailii]
MSVETALSYAALILADSEIEISSDKLLTLTNAANVPVEGIWADIFSRALEAQNLKDLLVNFSAGASVGGVAGVAGGASGEAAGEGEEEKEEEAKEESDDDMGFGLFD